MEKKSFVITHLRKKRFNRRMDDFSIKPTTKMQYCGQFVRRSFPCAIRVLDDYLTICTIVSL